MLSPWRAYIALHHHFSLGSLVHDPLRFETSGACPTRQRSEQPGSRQGGTVELKMRLNVAAAVMSFLFLAAIVFGMI